MMARTHLAFGFLAGLLLYPMFSGNKFVFFSLVLFGSILVDIDHPKSKIGRLVRPLSNIFNLFFGHRKLFHSLFFAIVLCGFVYMSLGKIYGVALFIGYLSHIVADCFTVSGINLFHPITNFRISGFVETGDASETVVLVGILVLIVMKLFSGQIVF